MLSFTFALFGFVPAAPLAHASPAISIRGATISCSAPAPVGFIGLGIMGGGMARRLLGAGIPLHVWTRDKEVSAALAADLTQPADVTVAPSPAAVLAACDRVYLMLSTPAACEEVYGMEGGVLAGVRAGATQVVDCATLRSEDMASLAERVRSRGGAFVEAPVSGSKGPAAQGALVFMAAGDAATYERCADEMAAMGKASFYCGEEVGAATRMKLVVNMVMSTQLAAIAEGIGLASELGLDVADLQSVLEAGATSSPMLALKGPLMARREYAPAFPLKYALKDIDFALGLQEALGLPVSAAAAATYAAADARHGDDDFSAVFEVAGRPAPK